MNGYFTNLFFKIYKLNILIETPIQTYIFIGKNPFKFRGGEG